jgi:hypothetical protein
MVRSPRANEVGTNDARKGSKVQKVLDVVLRRNRMEPDVPLCPDHKVEMRLRGKQGRPTRFSAQTEEEYTLIFFCPVEGCNQTGTRKRTKTQIPVPTEYPERPSFARQGNYQDPSL